MTTSSPASAARAAAASSTTPSWSQTAPIPNRSRCAITSSTTAPTRSLATKQSTTSIRVPSGMSESEAYAGSPSTASAAGWIGTMVAPRSCLSQRATPCAGRAVFRLSPTSFYAWAARAADGLGLPPGHVDVPTLHRIATVVARRVERPLVPVTTYLVGRALEHDPALTLEEATARIERLDLVPGHQRG